MTETHAGIDIADCVQGGRLEATQEERELLFDQLIVGATMSPLTFFVTVDKTALVDQDDDVSVGHQTSVAWHNDDGSRLATFVLKVGTFPPSRTQ